MPARSGGRYEVRNGKPVLIERTGYKPESEAKTDTAPKRVTEKESKDADA